MIKNKLNDLLISLKSPNYKIQLSIVWLVLISQCLITFTGSIVRVSASGLGCSTWPKCQPNSFIPTQTSMTPALHQIIEFGNRMITFLVIIIGILSVLIINKAKRRKEVKIYAWLIPIFTLIQAMIGGITVLTKLTWWTVALHLLVSMLMIWCATLLVTKTKEIDTIPPQLQVNKKIRYCIATATVLLVLVISLGTMVTGAGPHAGDRDPNQKIARLNISPEILVIFHSGLTICYIASVLILFLMLINTKANLNLQYYVIILLGLQITQMFFGIVQFRLKIPSVMVPIHILLAMFCVIITSLLWSKTKIRKIMD